MILLFNVRQDCESAKSIVSCFSYSVSEVFSQLNLCASPYIESVCCAKEKKEEKTWTQFLLLKNKRQAGRQLKANLISTPELNPDGMSRLDQFLFLIFCRLSSSSSFLSLSLFYSTKKLLLTRSTGTIDPSLSFLYDCLQPFSCIPTKSRSIWFAPSVIIS